MKLDPVTLRLAVGCGQGQAQTWCPYLQEACDLFGIGGAPRLAAFLAQIGHESASFGRVVENLNYSAGALVATWPHRFDLAHAVSIARNPQAIANAVYGNRMGNTEPNDGFTYRGRGLIQITGKGNYAAIRDYLRLLMQGVPDFVAMPDAMAEPRWAAMSAGAYWNDHKLNDLADALDFDGITRRINGGTEGAADRRVRYDRARKALNA